MRGEETAPARSDAGLFWSALDVRPAEVPRVRGLFVASMLVGFALVTFFSGSNAVFLDEVGAEHLPWVYLVNAVLVVAAGLGYAAWSRRASASTVLVASIAVLAVTVAVLWLWVVIAGGPAPAFAVAVWFRFLFIFGFLGLWEIASAVFDVRQAKRLFPAVALGAMLAFMLGGAAISVVAAVIGTEQLILVSALFFTLYGLAFRRVAASAELDRLDDAQPATPREIMADRFSRDLALMRSITILLVFITEFIFYEQVEATFASDETIARFLGLFLAGGTLAMVLVTAVVSSWFIDRFGIAVGLATMPAGLLISAIVLGGYGWLIGIDRTFFVLAVIANVINMVLANAIETPVGAVLYQPMPAERRMPVRVAVDGWLGSVALLVVGLLLLVFQAFDLRSVLPFVWLLAAVGVAGVLLARRLHGHYVDALGAATTLAFSGGSSDALAALDDGQGALQAGLLGGDPSAAFAVASLVHDLDEHPLRLVLPEMIGSPDDSVATIAVSAMASSDDPAHGPRLLTLVDDVERSPELRAAALNALHRLDPSAAARLAIDSALASGDRADDAFAVQLAAVRLAQADASVVDRVETLAGSAEANDRRTAARILHAAPTDAPLPPRSLASLHGLLGDPTRADDARDVETVHLAIDAAKGRVTDDIADRLVSLGHDVTHRRRVVGTLATAGQSAIDATEPVIDTLPESYVHDLVERVYGRATRRPVLLHRFVAPGASSALRRAGFAAIEQADIDLPATLVRMLRDDVERAQRLIDLTDDGLPELVRAACADEFAATQSTIWTGLRLGNDAKRIAELELVAAGGSPEQRANAIEALDTLLPRPLRDLVVPVLEPASLSEARELAVTTNESTNGPLAELREIVGLSEATRRLVDHYLSPQPEPSMSETLERVLALKRIDIFSTLSYELLVELAGVTVERRADAGERVLTEGEVGDELFALVDGQVEVERPDSADVTLRLEAGTVFGELAVLAPAPRSATVTAVTESTMLVLTRATLLALVDRHPSVMAEIARVLAERLQAGAA